MSSSFGLSQPHMTQIIKATILHNKIFVFSPLRLPVDEAERGVKKPAHLSQRPLLVNTDEEVRRWGRLEGHADLLSKPTRQIKSHNKHVI